MAKTNGFSKIIDGRKPLKCKIYFQNGNLCVGNKPSRDLNFHFSHETKLANQKLQLYINMFTYSI
jgi:hypothetical protein